MNELFGIPLDTLLAVLATALGVAAGILVVLAFRNPVLVRLGWRRFGRPVPTWIIATIISTMSWVVATMLCWMVLGIVLILRD